MMLRLQDMVELLLDEGANVLIPDGDVCAGDIPSLTVCFLCTRRIPLGYAMESQTSCR